MKKPASRALSSEPDPGNSKAIAPFDQAMDHCANIAAVAALLQGNDVRSLRSVLGEDAVTASGRLVAQEVEKLDKTAQVRPQQTPPVIPELSTGPALSRREKPTIFPHLQSLNLKPSTK